MKQVKELSDLKEYLDGMFNGRPGDHYPRINHAGKVTRSTVLALAGAVMSVHDAGSIVLREQNNRTTNVCWFAVRGKRHALVYRNGRVDLHVRSQQGHRLATFTDATLDQIGPVFASL
jgi:hypothetical protein